MTPPQQADGLLARTLREESGLLVARLARQFHDFDLAEEAVQTAVTEALEAWRRDGAAEQPGRLAADGRAAQRPGPGPAA